MSTSSYGSQMQQIESDAALRKIIDAETAEPGDRISYDDVEAFDDDRAWNDMKDTLRGRDLVLHDDGSGYVVAWGWSVDGDRLARPSTASRQPHS